MSYTSSVLKNDDVKKLISSNEKIINKILEIELPKIVLENTRIIKENIKYFLVKDIYEQIKLFSKMDILFFLESISIILSDQKLTQEEKLYIVECTLDDDLVYEYTSPTLADQQATKQQKPILGKWGLFRTGLGAAGGAYAVNQGGLNHLSNAKNYLSNTYDVTKGQIAGKNIGYQASQIGSAAHQVGKGFSDWALANPGVAAGVGLAGWGAWKGAKALMLRNKVEPPTPQPGVPTTQGGLIKNTGGVIKDTGKSLVRRGLMLGAMTALSPTVGSMLGSDTISNFGANSLEGLKKVVTGTSGMGSSLAARASPVLIPAAFSATKRLLGTKRGTAFKQKYFGPSSTTSATKIPPKSNIGKPPKTF